MDCSEAREEFAAYLDGELEEAQASRVRLHLEACAACKLAAQQLAAADALLGAFEEIEPVGDFTAQVMQKTFSMPQERVVDRLRLLRRLVPLAAAAVVLAALTMWFLPGRQAPVLASLPPAEQEAVKNLELLENMELLQDMHLLSELDLLLKYEEEDFESS